jgi:hypothetical protein
MEHVASKRDTWDETLISVLRRAFARALNGILFTLHNSHTLYGDIDIFVTVN